MGIFGSGVESVLEMGNALGMGGLSDMGDSPPSSSSPSPLKRDPKLKR